MKGNLRHSPRDQLSKYKEDESILYGNIYVCVYIHIYAFIYMHTYTFHICMHIHERAGKFIHQTDNLIIMVSSGEAGRVLGSGTLGLQPQRNVAYLSVAWAKRTSALATLFNFLQGETIQILSAQLKIINNHPLKGLSAVDCCTAITLGLDTCMSLPLF